MTFGPLYGSWPWASSIGAGSGALPSGWFWKLSDAPADRAPMAPDLRMNARRSMGVVIEIPRSHLPTGSLARLRNTSSCLALGLPAFRFEPAPLRAAGWFRRPPHLRYRHRLEHHVPQPIAAIGHVLPSIAEPLA